MAKATRGQKARLLGIVVASAIFASVCAILNSGIVSGVPPKPDLDHLAIAAATTHFSVDMPASEPSLIRRPGAPPGDVYTLTKRAEMLGRVVVSAPVLERIAARCDVAASDISGMGRTTANVPLSLIEPDSERRASEIQDSRAPYRVEVQGRALLPIVDVYTQAPTVESATCIADAAVPALRDYLNELAGQQHVAQTSMAQIQTLGPARGSVANGGATITIAFLTFMTVFGLCLVGAFGVWELRRRARRAKDGPRRLAILPEPDDDPNDRWPFTTRLLPWMFAIFLALIWLTPFNNIQLSASLPIELRLDRLLLPVLVAIWVLAIGVGGRIAPRLRMTWIHVAIGGLLACAFLSVVTDARYLNQSLELELSLKKLPLMLSYVTVFVIAASSIRRGEVRAFMTYTLGLALIVAFGMIWEYRMKQNLFWDWSDKLLPGIFTIDGTAAGDVVDHIGRRLVRGPAEVPLEAVAMLTMALPIALVRALHEPQWRQRVFYSLSVMVLIAAVFATYRKSALIVPVSVVLTLAYFRRSELLRLAPLGMVTLVIVSAVAPGAIGSTVRQFTRSDATSLPTVSDRSSDYDAVRPDVWSHLALGRGWGSYNHDSYRILDSEILQRVIETGVLGLLAFLLVSGTVVWVTRKPIAARDPETAPIALVGAMVAVAFLVAATLFDELSFPHAAYIFLYMVGLVTVVLPRTTAASPPPPEARIDVDARLSDYFAPQPDAQEPLVPAR